jgi:hypothetical protein
MGIGVASISAENDLITLSGLRNGDERILNKLYNQYFDKLLYFGLQQLNDEFAAIGRVVEAAQWLTKKTRASSFNDQDYYSNEIGDRFRSWHLNGFKTEFRPNFPDFGHAFQHFILYHKFNR